MSNMAAQFQRMQDMDLQGKRVLIREDLNVPVKSGKIQSDARLKASLPTIKQARDAGAAVLVCSHLGRPTEGEASAENSLQPVAEWLSAHLDQPVRLEKEYLNGVSVQPGEVVLLENVRFNPGEKKNHEALAKQYAALCDIFVMDAFGTAHRAEASTEGVTRQAKAACAGPLLAAELDALGKALAQPARPMVAVVAGSKVSTKLDVLNSLASICDQLIVGGGIANTFLAAAGLPIGRSLVEQEMVETARQIAAKVSVPLPVDVVTAKASDIDFDRFHDSLAQAQTTVKPVEAVESDDMIFDIGPKTAEHFASLVKQAQTILWNGPVGVFEVDSCGAGTQVLGEAIAASQGFSIAGGGDTLAAIEKYALGPKIGYISTGGGAFLEYVEGKLLPAVAALQARV